METCPTCGAPAERNYPMGIGNPQDGYTYQSPDSKGNASAEEQEDRDNFAIAFAVWAIHDPQAIAYRQARISAGDLLRKYKGRPYINTDLSTQ